MKVKSVSASNRRHVLGLLRDADGLRDKMNELGETAPYGDVRDCHNGYNSICCQLGMWSSHILAMLEPKKAPKRKAAK